jgi:predicted DCC family thiol-disulfide oxidoreductase YuxK
MKVYTLFSSLLYTLGWFICVYSGVYNWVLPPLVFTFLTLGFLLVTLKKQSIEKFYHTLFLLIYGAVLGLLMHMLFIISKVVSYAPFSSPSFIFPPLWIVCLQILFIPSLIQFTTLIKKRYFLMFTLGCIGAYFSYKSGVYLQALKNITPWGYGFIAIVWGFYLVAILYLSRVLLDDIQTLLSPMSLKKKLTVLFDGKCPVCFRESTLLQKRKQTGVVCYYFINTEKEFEKDFPQLKYENVLKEIHGITEEGVILKGVEVFHQLYARTDLPFLAIVCNGPFLKGFLAIIYRLWARFRLSNRG